ncbi:hypothetical protein DP42_5450 [Burkholderia pseudomallei]|nr:hypothetical protein DO73_5099 [Burkholderia pseudomallei]KGD07979.1 hypothetical protein DP42_5450 [Burkholderia pseudomallei]
MGMAARAFASGRVTCTSCTLHARRCLAFQHPPHPQYRAAVTHGVRDASSTGVFAQGKSSHGAKQAFPRAQTLRR